MNPKAKITPVERAEAELDGDLLTFVADLNDSCDLGVPESKIAMVDARVREAVAKAQAVIVARLKSRAYEVMESYRNSGADETLDADTWDAAVQAADPSRYDVMWMREWEA